MRRLALIGLLAVAACGESGETTGSGGCAAGVVWRDELYLSSGLGAADRRAGEALEGGYQPACHDTSPPDPDERDRPTRLAAIQGVPLEVAVLDRGVVQRNVAFPTAVPEHPFHDGTAVRRRRGGEPCTVEGTALERTWGLRIRTADGEVDVGIDPRTEFVGLDRAGLPHIAEGAALRIRGRCSKDGPIARRIEPRP